MFATLLSAADVDFSGVCSNGGFVAVGADIEYFNLDLDIDAGGVLSSKECLFTTTLPARSGYYIAVSKFQLQGNALINSGGFAQFFVNHRVNGALVPGVRKTLYTSGDMNLVQEAVGNTSCNQSLVLRTKVTGKAKEALLLQDAAGSVLQYRCEYRPC
jgi:hypothetical protein